MYTDLAVESHEALLAGQNVASVDGVTVETESKPIGEVSRVRVDTDWAAKAMGKAKGTYVTIQSTALKERNEEHLEQLSEQVASEIVHFLELMQIPENGSCLVIGLGNWNATPDALGPRVVGELLVTRHLYEMSPPELRGGLRPVSALSPGVLGLTGIETGEIVKGLVDRIRPDVVICVDALAAREVDRLCTTIQLSDAGISPGAGVGNVRQTINKDSLGVPVLVIGVPTVVHAMTIVADAVDTITVSMSGQQQALSSFHEHHPQLGQAITLDPQRIDVHGAAKMADGSTKGGRYDVLGLPLDQSQKRFLLRDLLGPDFSHMIVTPKEIDVLIEDMADCVAGALNVALHPALDLDDILMYLQG